MTGSPRIYFLRARAPAFWAAAALLAAAVAVLALEIGWGNSPAIAQAPAAAHILGSGSVIVVAGQITTDTYGLYLVDAERSTISVYQWLPSTQKLRLMAARNYSYDLQLEQYNTVPPPQEIKKLLDQARAGGAETRPSNQP